jgi:2,3-bisphosphoglycerate-independent phosphoglycerate mutase
LSEKGSSKYHNLPLALVILDGWGIAAPWGGNAISMGKTPNMDRLTRTMPYTTLQASAEAVGLPHGVMGNSEVGHLNIGAGRVVKQYLPLINDQIKDRTFFKNQVLVSAMKRATSGDKALHIFGIASDGGVHGHINHILALIEMAKILELKKVFIHAITDGRDTEPTSALQFIDKIEAFIKQSKSPARIVDLVGRYFAMDRDTRWDRIEKAYNAYVNKKGVPFANTKDAILDCYNKGVYDEFFEPILIKDSTGKIEQVNDGDVLIFSNYREDRMREIVQAMSGVDCGFNRGHGAPKVAIATFVQYQAGLPAEVAFHPEAIENSLSDCLAECGLRQFHIAETEKYAHVTYFFNGGVESPQALETRLLIPSPKVAKYNQEPECSAKEITDRLVEKLHKNEFDFYVVNYANTDLVGHTGDIRATVSAVEYVDLCIGRIWKEIEQSNGTLMITGDHGNAEEMISPETGLPDTEHTKNPVPLIIYSNNAEVSKIKLKKDGALGNVAPTILELIGIEKPVEMTLDSLIQKS